MPADTNRHAAVVSQQRDLADARRSGLPEEPSFELSVTNEMFQPTRERALDDALLHVGVQREVIIFWPLWYALHHDGPRLESAVLSEVLKRGLEAAFSYLRRHVGMLSQIRRLVERAFDVGRDLPRMSGQIDLRPEETGARATEDARQ